jgi:hypothetical protein
MRVRYSTVSQRSNLPTAHHASSVLTAMMWASGVLLVVCSVAVLPTLCLSYTYEIKHLDVPVSNNLRMERRQYPVLELCSSHCSWFEGRVTSMLDFIQRNHLKSMENQKEM